MARRTRDLDGSDFDGRGLDDSGVLRPPSGGWQVRSASASDAGADPAPVDATDATGAPLTERGARRVFGALCVIACAAGDPGPGQRRELAEFQEYLGLSDACARLLERQARRGAGTLRIGKRPAELEFLMGALIDVAAADGAVSRVARSLIGRVNERARWSRDRLEAAIAAAVARERGDASGLFDATLLPSAPARRAQRVDASGLFDATLLPSKPTRRARVDESGLFDATLLPSAPRARATAPPSAGFDDSLDALLDDVDDDAPAHRSSTPRGLEDSGEGELLVLGSPWFERG